MLCGETGGASRAARRRNSCREKFEVPCVGVVLCRHFSPHGINWRRQLPRAMDGSRCHSSSASTVKPTFALELAGLCRVMISEPQQRPCSSPGPQQYPAVDFSRYPSLRRFLSSSLYSSSSSSPLNFRISGACGSKRLRVDGDGGASEATTTAVTLPVGLASLAGCRPSSSSNSKRVDAGQIFLSRRGVGLETTEQDDPPEESRSDSEQQNLLDVQEDPGGADPVEVLGSEVFEHILSFLDWRSLGICLSVSGGWNKCSQASFIWDKHCGQMWEGKINVISNVMDPAIPRLRAFQISMAEAKRVRIEPGDLCRWVWELHYKEHAGEYWRQLDPYYHGLPLMRRIFHKDGHVTAEPMDQIWGGHECSWTLRKFKSRGGIPLVRINHWPPMVVTRTSNWGWQIENAWVVYTSTNIPTGAGRT